MKITFDITCGLVNNQGPNVEILINHYVIHDITLGPENIFSIEIDNRADTDIIIVHKNKTDHDTVVNNGIIVADKYLKINRIWVDDILLSELLCYTECHLEYSQSYLDSNTNVLPSTVRSNDLYFNGKLVYTFKKDFFQWYYSLQKNSDLQSITDNLDPEAEEKFLGYTQESSAEKEIIDLLKGHGYHITN